MTPSDIRPGCVSVGPAFCKVAHDDGRHEIPEPRVMQVLVALATADRIVSRNIKVGYRLIVHVPGNAEVAPASKPQ